jgi:soluble lytic murein transglycosylase-like protein
MNITLMTLIMALISVESSGGDHEVGDNGQAWGCLQMHAGYVQDAAEHAGEDWTHQDAFDRETAIQIITAYMDRYATEARLGRPVMAEDIARIHNGGPNGYKKTATDQYCVKVRAEILKIKTTNK